MAPDLSHQISGGERMKILNTKQVEEWKCAIEKAKKHFGKVLWEQLERVERLKKEKSWPLKKRSALRREKKKKEYEKLKKLGKI